MIRTLLYDIEIRKCKIRAGTSRGLELFLATGSKLLTEDRADATLTTPMLRLRHHTESEGGGERDYLHVRLPLARISRDSGGKMERVLVSALRRKLTDAEKSERDVDPKIRLVRPAECVT